MAEIREALDEHESRLRQLHAMVLEARDLIRPHLKPDSPTWLREAFEKLHAVHHGMGGDPYYMRISAVLARRATDG